MIIFNFLMSYIIFPLFFSSIIYIFATIEKHSYTKGIILILGILIFINYYFYKKIVMIIRKTYVNRINYYLSIILIFLTFFNIENFKEVIKIINQNIKNNFNQEIFLEIKNILNTVSYFYLFYFILLIGIIFLLTIIYNIFKNRKINKKVKENNEEIKLLSFRKKEKDKLKSMIENKKISSILIEAEIGNGKTTLINSLFKDLQNEEIIYLKLPLIKSVDELKRNLFLELQKIFLKNDLDNQFINAFLDNISAFKLGFLEINFGKKENMWNTIKKLQNTLKELDKNIIVVLDDIERENDANKIYESILFLGELSEYFKNTKTTTLLLVQYSYLEDKLKEINKDRFYLEKYYKYKFKLNEPTASEFSDEDYKIIIEEMISTSTDLIIENDKKEDFINSIIENINFFFYSHEPVFHIENSNYIKLNIRALEKSIKKIIYLYTFYKDNYIIYSIFQYCILKENFNLIIDEYFFKLRKEKIEFSFKTKRPLEIYLSYSLKNCLKNNTHINIEELIDNIFVEEIKSIIEIYKKGEFLIEKVDIQSNITKKILYENTKLFEIYSVNEYVNIQSNIIKKILDKNIVIPGILSINGYEEYIFHLINCSSVKLDNVLKNNFIVNKSELIKTINSINDSLKLSKDSIDNIKKILLEQDYTFKEDEIVITSFLQKINEIEDLKPNLPEITKLLNEDNNQ